MPDRDPLSDVLSLIDARTVVTNGLRAGGDWALHCPAPDGLKFVAVVTGGAWLTPAGQPPHRLVAGDVLLLNGSAPYVLGSDPDLPPICASTIFADARDGIGRIGETGTPGTTMIGGRVVMERAGGHLLLDVLPDFVHLRGEGAEARATRWLIERIDAELGSQRPGSELAVSQLAQLIVVQLLRAHLEQDRGAIAGDGAAASHDGAGTGTWLHGLAHPRIAPVLRALHAEPARPWRLAELAGVAAMSRTAFAELFRAVTGMTPIAYLSRWRMHLAERALARPGATIGRVGHALGYDSEAAFSTAFKRIRGQSPSAYARSARAATELVALR